ncbi:hypothetical protein GE21DRAFT_3095 [Neurospora crassa]|uniref:Uncharacterized protein n=2 Tax=Neurospora crassa TaxID=5141 RepID=Q1K8Y1_NEUCR|nr:hypothetical protein NCU06793 [Neurospora crassa OR74A]EAA34398.1 hypothetical protein NCU06793 [Neurospora crassa OR74A]KHE87640.1 hypothetical protein GE21DRAFT_3095 [Neurospora crassa]CAB91732.2 conserved hypothetical protein [Neurospora crassa]|eukprot:XP_963634.1 hypothetical protein NCU06793 [Neurospora crassa OR74A]
MYAHDSKAIRGNFIPVSKSMNARAPTPPREPSENIHHFLQLSLTESQMEKLAKVLSEDGDTERESRGRQAPQTEVQQPDVVDSATPKPKAKEHQTLKQRFRSLSPAKRRKHQQEVVATPPRQRSPSPVRRGTGPKTSEQRRLGYGSDSYQSPQPASKQRQFHQHQVSWDRQYDSPKPVSRQRQQQCMSPQSASRQRQEHQQEQRAANTAAEAAAFRLASPFPSKRRQDRVPLAPIDTDIARLHAKVTAHREPIVIHYSPEPDARVASQTVQIVATDKSSVYSQENQEKAPDPRFRSQISPLHVVKENKENDSGYSQTLSILQDYGNWSNWANSEEPVQNSQGPEVTRAPTKLSNRSADRPGTDGATGTDDFHYSALTPLFPVHNINNPNRNMRMASKTLIGENGWLESTSRPSDAPLNNQLNTATSNGTNKKPSTAVPARKPGFLDNLVKKAKDFVSAPLPENAINQRSSHDSNKPHSARTLQISLTPREQSLLYCELEFLLSTLLNTYITTQLSLGLLDHNKVRRISDTWQSKGRPRVVSFRYDLETQLDLVRLHVNDFKFYGPAAANTTTIMGIVDGAKLDARAMRIRTFCQPDTVVAKQLVGARALCGLLGAGDTEERKLGECVGFFRAVVEREVQKGMIEVAAGGNGGNGGGGETTMDEQQQQRESGNTTTSGDGIWVGGAPQYQGPPSPIPEQNLNQTQTQAQIQSRSQSPVRRGGHSLDESNKWHQHHHHQQQQRQHNTAPGHPGASGGHNHALSSPVRFTTFAAATSGGHLKGSASQGIIKMDPSAYEDDIHPGSKIF